MHESPQILTSTTTTTMTMMIMIMASTKQRRRWLVLVIVTKKKEAMEDIFLDLYHTENISSRSSRMTTEEPSSSASSSFDAILVRTCYTNRSTAVITEFAWGSSLAMGPTHDPSIQLSSRDAGRGLYAIESVADDHRQYVE